MQQRDRDNDTIEQDGDAPLHAELRRLEASETATRDALEESLDRLNRIVRTAGQDQGAASLPPTSAAVVRIARAYGADASVGRDERTALHREADVCRLARLVGLRARQIVLEENWWRHDHGHFVARLHAEAAHEKEDTPPGEESAKTVMVALVRHGSRGYALYGPDATHAIPVTKEIARRISPLATELLPGLREEIASVGELARFLFPTIRRDLAWTAAIGAALGALGALFPIATAFVIDDLVPGQEITLLVQVGIALAVAAVVNATLSVTHELLQLRIDGRTRLVMEGAVWDRLLRLPASFFKEYASGDLQARLAGVGRVRSALLGVALSVVTTTVFSVFYLSLLFYYDPRLAALAMGLVLVITAVTLIVGLVQLKYHRRQIEIAGWTTGYVFQVLQAIIKLRIAGAEDRAFVRWAERYGDERAAVLKLRRISNHFGAFSAAYDTLALAAIFAGVYLLSEARLSTGLFIAFLAAFASLQAAFQGLGGTFLTLLSILPDWHRAQPLLEAKPERQRHAADPGVLSGALEMANVTFAYGDGPRVVDGVSLAAASGEHIALVGESGSGKSTLVRIMLGLEPAQTGAMLYDGQDIKGLDLAGVRRQIGVVTQTGRLAAGTIMENVRGATSASFEECLEACERAGLGDDLANLPMGLHTPLTEGGSTLSGGQRQRILIARALVGKPRLLIFDEATSALDNRTQAMVTESVADLDLTRVTVAHRLSTIQDADRIYVLADGRVAERGTFDELMAQKGLFAAAAARQLTEDPTPPRQVKRQAEQDAAR